MFIGDRRISTVLEQQLDHFWTASTCRNVQRRFTILE
jgi:hypothetical protein